MTEREIAVSVLGEVLIKGGYNNIALRRAFEKNAGLSQKQKAFATELVNGSLRRLFYLDYVIGKTSTTAVPDMKPFILNVLRVSCYQLLFLSGAPDYAVCSEAVDMAKRAGFEKLGGFVNAVLRSILRARDGSEDKSVPYALPDKDKETLSYLSVRYSYPEWMISRFLKQFGGARTENMLEYNSTAPKVHIYANRLKADPAGLFEGLAAKGIGLKPGFCPEAAEISGASDITALDEFKRGEFHVIDKSSVLAALALDPKEGSVVLDLCAAPGGKSFVLAELMGDKGRLTACDIHEHKIELIRSGAKRLGLNCIEPELEDASKEDARFIGTADYILVDAPCSGLGLVRKKPDIKYTKTEDDIQKLAALQRRLLGTAFKYLKPGGVLLYCNCTLTDEENYNNAGWFAKNFAVKKDNMSDFADKYGLGASVSYGYLSILPQEFGSDGFFISRFIRNA